MSYIKIDLTKDGFKCNISNNINNFLNPEHFPLKFKVCDLMEKITFYECKLNGGMWASCGKYRDLKAQVFTKDGILLKERKYSYIDEDLELYEFWDYFCKMNKDKIGLIVGSGDGSWGEWVESVNENKIDCHLVEASITIFEELESNYKNSFNFKLYNDVITKDGLDCKFYNISDGLSSTNVEYLNKNGISYSDYEIRKTKEINKFLSEIGKIDWIRFDVEGIDYDLITTINPDYFNDLIMIQYEHMNLEKEKQEEIEKIFISKNFKKLTFDIDTIFIK